MRVPLQKLQRQEAAELRTEEPAEQVPAITKKGKNLAELRANLEPAPCRVDTSLEEATTKKPTHPKAGRPPKPQAKKNPALQPPVAAPRDETTSQRAPNRAPAKLRSESAPAHLPTAAVPPVPQETSFREDGAAHSSAAVSVRGQNGGTEAAAGGEKPGSEGARPADSGSGAADPRKLRNVRSTADEDNPAPPPAEGCEEVSRSQRHEAEPSGAATGPGASKKRKAPARKVPAAKRVKAGVSVSEPSGAPQPTPQDSTGVARGRPPAPKKQAQSKRKAATQDPDAAAAQPLKKARQADCRAGSQVTPPAASREELPPPSFAEVQQLCELYNDSPTPSLVTQGRTQNSGLAPELAAAAQDLVESPFSAPAPLPRSPAPQDKERTLKAGGVAAGRPPAPGSPKGQVHPTVPDPGRQEKRGAAEAGRGAKGRGGPANSHPAAAQKRTKVANPGSSSLHATACPAGGGETSTGAPACENQDVGAGHVGVAAGASLAAEPQLPAGAQAAGNQRVDYTAEGASIQAHGTEGENPADGDQLMEEDVEEGELISQLFPPFSPTSPSLP
jgi:hypothetical protein